MSQNPDIEPNCNSIGIAGSGASLDGVEFLKSKSHHILFDHMIIWYFWICLIIPDELFTSLL